MVRGHTTFSSAVWRRRGGSRCARPHGTVLRPPGWQPAVCRHPSPARLPGRGRQHSHHTQRGHHTQHYRHAQPETTEQRCQLGPRGHHDRAGIVAQQRERHPPSPLGPGTTTPGGPLDRCTHSPLQSAPRPTGALSTPTRAQPRTPPRRHKLTSLSPVRHGDPSSSRPYFTASLLGLPWVYLLGVCRWALPCSCSGLQGAWTCWLVPPPPRGGEKIQSCLRSTIRWREPNPRLAPGATPRQREGLVRGRLALRLGTNLGTPPLPC